ncbi:MAG: hypothetical protein SGBAC_011023 [Bacillariaceae sp.]
MRSKGTTLYVENILRQWRSVFGCGDVDDTESTSDLVMRKHSRENPKRKNNSKNTQKWLRQVSSKLMEQSKIERIDTDSTSDSQSARPIETNLRAQSLAQANQMNYSRKDGTIPAFIETVRIDSLPNTDVTGDSQFDEPIQAPIKLAQPSYTFQNSDLTSFSRIEETTLATIDNTRRVQSLPNTPTHANGPLRAQKRNPEREAFFKVRVYDLGYNVDKQVLSDICDTTQRDDYSKGWPNDFYSPQN